MRRWINRALVLGLLAAGTAWNISRSPRLEEAAEAYGRGRYLPALMAALDHLDARPWSRSAARLAALCLSRLDYSELAEPYYRRSGTLSRDDLLVRAYAILRSNRREAAIVAYRSILDRWPAEPVALRNLATVYLTQGRYREALEVAERLEAVPGQEVVGATMVGTMNYRMGEPERAIAAFERAERLDPGLRSMPEFAPQFARYYGEMLTSVGRAREAVDRLAPASADQPDDLLLLDRLGAAYQALGMLEEAEECWRREVRLDANALDGWINLGKLALARGRPEEAVGPLDRAVDLDPTSYSALYNLLLAHRRLGHAEEARSLQARLDAVKAGQGTPTARMGSPPLPPEDSHD